MHHETDAIQLAVQKSFQNHLIYNRWLNCCLDAIKCCQTTLSISSSLNETDKCPAVWDGWSCIDSENAGKTVQLICSKYSYTGQPPRCNR